MVISDGDTVCVCTVQAVVNGRWPWPIHANSSVLPRWIVKTRQTTRVHSGNLWFINHQYNCDHDLYLCSQSFSNKYLFNCLTRFVVKLIQQSCSSCWYTFC